MDGAKMHHIVISKDNQEQYGFSCFHHEGEPQIHNGFWDRDIELAQGPANSKEKVIFRIPEELLICLPEQAKIANHPRYSIQSVSSSVPSIKLLSERAGWNQTEKDLESMCSKARDGAFLAQYAAGNRQLTLGSGVSLPINEDLAWIGMILVHPELRRQGIARSMMYHCLQHARRSQHKSIVGLDATPLGKQVYDSLGFKDSFLIWRSIISTFTGTDWTQTSQVNSLDLRKAKAYLAKQNYTERSALVETISQLPGSYNLQAASGGDVRGIALSRPGRLRPFVGTLMADTPDIALDLISTMRLYWHKKGYREVFMDIPEWHLDGSSAFSTESSKEKQGSRQMSVSPVRSFVRMYQLISPEEMLSFKAGGEQDHLINRPVDGFEKTATFMNKEKNELVPFIYGTFGPEWS